MRWPLASNLSPIGLDLGAHSFKAVQLRRVGGRWQSTTSVSLTRTTPGGPLAAGEIDRMRGVLDRRGFVGRDVVLAVPSTGVLSAMLELPARAPGLPLEQIAAAEFGRVHKLDAAAVTMATWDLPASARATKATHQMAVGVKTEVLDAHVTAIESAGLSVVAVDEPYSAACRGAAVGDTQSPDGFAAVLDFGWDAARLSLLLHGTLVYTRRLAEAGLAAAVRAVADVDDGTDAEQAVLQHGLLGVDDSAAADVLGGHTAAMLRDVGLAFGYAARQYGDRPMGRLTLVGGGAGVPGLADRVAGTLGVPTSVAADAPFALAAGLAVWEAAR